MAVNLSPVGGVAAQFFTNTGAVLTGGKLFTYLAGTTTPATAYTTSAGNVPWTNPIVLDAAGRVSGSGEIWLTDGIIYKFVLKDSNDVLIATYDNITGINSNSVAYTNQQEIVTATAGQTVFNLSISYQPGTNSLSVFVDGVNQYGPGAQYAYIETDADTVTFVSGLHVGAEVKFTTTQQQGAGAVNASQVSYDPPFANSVPTNVEAKLAETVSVTDFGADPTGVADSTQAIQDALDSISSGNVFFPAGTYIITSPIRLYAEKGMIGESLSSVTIQKTTTTVDTLSPVLAPNGVSDVYAVDSVISIVHSPSEFARNVRIENIAIVRDLLGTSSYGIYAPRIGYANFANLRITKADSAFECYTLFLTKCNTVTAVACANSFALTDDGSGDGGSTSLILQNYYANGSNSITNPTNGIFLYGLSYSTLISCAVDNYTRTDTTATTAYSLQGCVGVNLIGCGVETLKGCIIRLLNCETIVVQGLTALSLTGATFGSTVGARQINSSRATFIGCSYAAIASPGNIYNNLVQTGSQITDINEGVAISGGNSSNGMSTTESWSILASGKWTNTVPAGTQVLKYGYTGTAAPTTGTWAQGDIVYNTNPTAGGFFGFICVTAGTPGTWKTFAPISA
jgi:hypothetical protein